MRLHKKMVSEFAELVPLCKKVNEQHGENAVVVLFGSRARGDHEAWSDYDVLVLADFTGNASRDQTLYRSVKELRVDLQCLTHAEYEDRLRCWADGKSPPAVEGAMPSRSEIGMSVSAIDGVCLVGDAAFQRFRDLRDQWVAAGLVSDLQLLRFASVEDGLVQSQRLLLSGLSKERFLKSAKIVGHATKEGVAGASYLYRLLVRMLQPFVTRYPLVIGQGNFGSIWGTPWAGMRYTECRSSRFLLFGRDGEDYVKPDELREVAEALLALANRNDVTPQEVRLASSKLLARKKQSHWLPPVFPQLLANGTMGMPGIDTSVPSFWLSGVSAALQLAIEKSTATDGELLDALGPPYFATGGVLVDLDQTRSALELGEGVVRVRGRIEVGKTIEGDGQAVVIRDLPYGVPGHDLEEAIGTLSSNKGLPGVGKVANHTSYEGVCIELPVTSSANPNELQKRMRAMPAMNVEIPVEVTVTREGQAVRLSVPELVRYEADQRLRRWDGLKRKVLEELHCLHDLESGPRRTLVL